MVNIDKEVETIEDKSSLYLLFVGRRLFKNIWFKLFPSKELKDFSIMIKIIPVDKISILDFQQIIEQILEKERLVEKDSEQDFKFESFVDYKASEIEFVEEKEETGEHSEENVAEYVTIELKPLNFNYIKIPIEDLSNIILTKFLNILVTLKKSLMHQSEFVFNFYFAKNIKVNFQKVEEEFKKSGFKVSYFSEEELEKISLLIHETSINDKDKVKSILGKI